MRPSASIAPLLALPAAALLSVAFVPIAIRLGKTIGMMDLPDGERRIHVTPVPRTGGLAVFLSVVLAVGSVILGFEPDHSSGWAAASSGTFASVCLVLLVGAVDDWRSVSPLAKLFVQSCAAWFAIRCGFNLERLALTPSLSIATGIFAGPLAFIWLIGVTNAVNLVDGVDSLASTVGITACISSAVASTVLGLDHAGVIAFAIAGALLGFSRYNRNPARVFLGDAGSMSLGFTLALLSVYSSTDRSGNTFVLIPLFGLAYPIADTTVAIARRWLRGHPFSRADGRHIHHRLLASGLSADRAVSIIAVCFSAVAAAGLVITFAPPPLTFALFVGTGIVAFAGGAYAVRWLQYTEFVELAAACWSVAVNGRSALQAKIIAGDLADRIGSAHSLDEVRRILSDGTDDLRLLSLELVVDGDSDKPSSIAIAPHCRLDYHLTKNNRPESRSVILRIWGRRRSPSSSNLSVERVASRIAPAIEEWLQRHPDVLESGRGRAKAVGETDARSSRSTETRLTWS